MNSGFSLVEMAVVLSIVILMISAMLLSSSRFGSDLLLSNLSYDIASTIREAQSYGLSTKNWAKNLNSSSPNQGFDRGYGIRFGKDNSNKFAMFFETNDSNGVNNWHCGATGDSNSSPSNIAGCEISSEFMKDYIISGSRSAISKICATYVDGSKDCYNFSTPSAPGQISYLDIIFRRSGPEGLPQPDAYISTDLAVYPNAYQSAEITLSSNTGFTKVVSVNQIGQISVK